MKILTLARDLRRRKGRERQGLFVAEGVRTVEELLRSSIPVRGVLHTTAVANTERGSALMAAVRERDVPAEEVGDAELESAAETESPQGVLAVAAIPENR